jgi:hypothetical protein
MTGSDLVKRLGALRDGLLVCSSIVYTLGCLKTEPISIGKSPLTPWIEKSIY